MHSGSRQLGVTKTRRSNPSRGDRTHVFTAMTMPSGVLEFTVESSTLRTYIEESRPSEPFGNTHRTFQLLHTSSTLSKLDIKHLPT